MGSRSDARSGILEVSTDAEPAQAACRSDQSADKEAGARAIGVLVLVQHPDGTLVVVNLKPLRVPDAIPLTPDQVADIGRGFTLFP